MDIAVLIGEIKAICAEASPGPWYCYTLGQVGAQKDSLVKIRIANVFGNDDPTAMCCGRRKQNARFVAAARNYLPTCVELIEKLQAENEQLKAQVAEFQPAWMLQQIRAGNCTYEPSPLPVAQITGSTE